MSINATNNPYPEDPDAAPTKLDRGGYLGDAQNLDEKINANLTEAKALIESFKGSTDFGSITPTSVPTGTGPGFWRATQNGTYTNFGGLIVNANSFAVISRNAAGVFSISQTVLNLTEYQKIVDGNKINPWTAKAYLLGDQVNYSGKDWVSNSATVASDVPGASTKWIERLTAYVNSESIKQTLNKDSFPFTDKFGNVIFEITVDGSKALSYKIFDPITKLEVISLNKTWFDNLTTVLNNIPVLTGWKQILQQDSFCFVDAVGNLMFKIDVDGSKSTAYKIIDPATKTEVVSLDKTWFNNLNTFLASLQSSIPVLNGWKQILQQDSFCFVDAVGNLMFKIGVDGSKSTAYKIIDPETKTEVVSLDKTWFNNLNTLLNNIPKLSSIKETARPDGYYFTDSVGNVIAKMTANGLQAIKFLNKNGEELGSAPSAPKKLDGKLVVSIGDSHASSPWLSKFCSLTGSTSNSSLQTAIMNNQYNYTDSGIMMGIAKALNQYSIDNTITPDVILIENCHFANDGTKTIADYAPMIYDNLQIYGTTYASYSSFVSTVNADKTAFIASLTPKIKTALRFNFSTFKHTITFASSGALTAGTIQLTINGSVFPVNIAVGQTLAQAITALNDWAFNETVTGWTNASTKGAVRTTTIELVYTGSSNPPTSPIVSFNAGNTGMTMTANALSSTVGFQDYYFNSLLLSDWNNSAKWDATNGTTTYPAMMGLIEYLKVKFPLAEIVVWAVQWLSVSNTPTDANSYMVETFAGSGVYARSILKYYQDASVIKYLKSKEAMRITAQYYGCRFIDVDSNCGINIFNMFNGYYSANNLHPLTLGYEKWGQTLAQLY